jgi:hypothetical protein
MALDLNGSLHQRTGAGFVMRPTMPLRREACVVMTVKEMATRFGVEWHGFRKTLSGAERLPASG